jgi:protocatechuate 3,4-dioxygenase beta subunit
VKKQKTHSRREVTKKIGMAAGLALIPGSFASAATPTPEQVKGPFHPVVEQSDTDMNLVMIEGRSEAAKGEVILVRGQVVDSDGEPLADALVDVWQANDDGRYSHPKDTNTAPLDPNFQGWGLVKTDADGRYGIKTIKPGPYPLSFLGDEGWRCRHIHFEVSHSDHDTLVTQMYFDGDPLIEADQEIAKVPDELRHLLIAKSQPDEATGLPLYRFDLVLARAEV